MNNCVHALGSFTSDVEWDNPDDKAGQTAFQFYQIPTVALFHYASKVLDRFIDPLQSWT